MAGVEHPRETTSICRRGAQLSRVEGQERAQLRFSGEPPGRTRRQQEFSHAVGHQSASLDAADAGLPGLRVQGQSLPIAEEWQSAQFGRCVGISQTQLRERSNSFVSATCVSIRARELDANVGAAAEGNVRFALGGPQIAMGGGCDQCAVSGRRYGSPTGLSALRRQGPWWSVPFACAGPGRNTFRSSQSFGDAQSPLRCGPARPWRSPAWKGFR